MSSSAPAATPTAPPRRSASTSVARRCSASCSTPSGKVLREERRSSPHAGVDALVAHRVGDRRRARAARTSRGRCRRGRSRQPRRAGALLAEPADRPRGAVAATRSAAATAPPARRRQRRERRGARRDRVRRRARPAPRAARDARHRYRWRHAAQRRAVPRRARVRRRDRAHHRRARRSACARAASSGTGRRSRRGARSDGWRASSSRGAAALGSSNAAGGDVDGDHRRARRAGGPSRATPTPARLLEDYADNVALGLAALANVLDPEVIVIAGGMVELGPLLFDPLARRRSCSTSRAGSTGPRSRSCPAELGGRAAGA